MSLLTQRSDWFVADFENQARWYVRHADEQVAARYLTAIDHTLRLLIEHPKLGRRRNFQLTELLGFRSYRVEPPFNKHLIFYRHDDTTLYAERIIHGARDLPRRLLQPPATD